MPHKDVRFRETGLGVDVVDADPVVKTGNDQLPTHYVAPVDWNLIAANFVLVPEKNQLILVASEENGAENETHAHLLLVV